MLSDTRLGKISRIVCFVAILLMGVVVCAQQSGHTLNNDDIIKMTSGGFDEAVIVALVDSNPTDFDVSIDGLNALKAANVSGKVMEAMLKAEAKKRQGAAPVPTAQPAGLAPSAPAPTMVPNPAMSAMGGGNMQQMMAMAMSMRGMGGMGGMGMGSGMLDTSQLPPLNLITDVTRLQVKPSIAQIANTETKGDGMPGAGSQATGMLMGLGRQALSFGAIGGGMFAGPAAGMAMGMMGGMGHHHGPPKVTYVWALPGHASSTVVASNKPRFEMSFGNLLGIDPDAYEPQLIKLVSSKDNWRLVGATKTTMGQMSTEAYEKVTEARIAVKSERTGRGEVQLEPKQPLEPGEYAVVLRAIHPGKRAEGSLGGGAETSIFFSVWDFSVNTDAKVKR
jgi:hypothetical protein